MIDNNAAMKEIVFIKEDGQSKAIRMYRIANDNQNGNLVQVLKPNTTELKKYDENDDWKRYADTIAEEVKETVKAAVGVNATGKVVKKRRKRS